MRTIVLVVLLAVSVLGDVLTTKKIKCGRRTCTCTFSLASLGPYSCGFNIKCDKKCSGVCKRVKLSGDRGVYTLDMKVKRGKVYSQRCSVVLRTTTTTSTTTTPTTTTPTTTTPTTTTPTTSPATRCTPGFTAVCPLMGDNCPPGMEKLCPGGRERMLLENRMSGGSSDCQCVPDFLIYLVRQVHSEEKNGNLESRARRPACTCVGSWTGETPTTTTEDCDRVCATSPSKICVFNFTIMEQQTDTKGRKADGRIRSVVTYNGVLPGPPIVICEGDQLVVNLENKLSGVGSTIHWHGIRQLNTPFSDGVPLVTQCPVESGDTFSYTFNATKENSPPGTYWYHSHVGDERTNGAYGALIIKDKYPKYPKYVDDARNTLVLQEWYKSSTNQIPVSILINGNGRVGEKMLHGSKDAIANFLVGNGIGSGWSYVSNPVYHPTNFATKYTEYSIENPGLEYRFRIIGAISQNVPLRMSIEDHTFKVIATDSLYIEPVEELTDLWLSAAERYDIVVKTKNAYSYRKGEAYKIQLFGYIDNYPLCSIAWLKYPTQNINDAYVVPHDCSGFLNLKSPRRTLNPVPKNTNWKHRLSYPEWKDTTKPGNIFVNDLRDAEQENTALTLNTQYLEIAKGAITFNQIEMAYPSVPFLLQDPQNDTNRCGVKCKADECEDIKAESSTCEHVIQQPWMQNWWAETVIINNHENNVAHPIHQHGGWYWVVGMGQFNYTDGINRTFIMEQDSSCFQGKYCLPRNLKKPPPKDTIQIPPNGYVIFRTKLDNAGSWIVHCHIEHHLEMGMALILQFGTFKDWPTGSLKPNEKCPSPPPPPDPKNTIKWEYKPDKAYEPVCITPGQQLHFTCEHNAHNVNLITYDEYNNCAVDNSTNCQGQIAYTFTAPKETGAYYFACGKESGNHCRDGNMRIQVDVKNQCP